MPDVNWFGVVIISAFLISAFLFGNRKKIILIIIKWAYGPFSYTYVQFHKRFYIRNPHPYCFREEFVQHVLFILEKKNNLPTFKTPKTISFEDVQFNYPFRLFLKKKGRPNCFNTYYFDIPGFVIKAAGYPVRIMGKKATAVYYFMNDHFFMGEYIFKRSNPEIKYDFFKFYLKKNSPAGDNFYVENSGKRIIHFQDTGFTVDIKFLCQENSEVVLNLKTYYNQLSSAKELEEVLLESGFI